MSCFISLGEGSDSPPSVAAATSTKALAASLAFLASDNALAALASAQRILSLSAASLVACTLAACTLATSVLAASALTAAILALVYINTITTATDEHSFIALIFITDRIINWIIFQT